jgi:hypothetical protein
VFSCAAEELIPFQVQVEALEPAGEIEHPITAAFQDFDLAVEAFDKAAGLAIQKVIGDLIEMMIQGRKELFKARNRLHRDELTPGLQPVSGLGFRLDLNEDRGQHLVQQMLPCVDTVLPVNPLKRQPFPASKLDLYPLELEVVF